MAVKESWVHNHGFIIVIHTALDHEDAQRRVRVCEPRGDNAARTPACEFHVRASILVMRLLAAASLPEYTDMRISASLTSNDDHVHLTNIVGKLCV